MAVALADMHRWQQSLSERLAHADLAEIPQRGWHAAVTSCNLLCSQLHNSFCVDMMLKVSMPSCCMLMHTPCSACLLLIETGASSQPSMLSLVLAQFC